MTDDPRVQRLLDLLLDSHATPEEVCAECTELLPVVRERWRQIRRLRADLDALFPVAADSTPHPLGETAHTPPPDAQPAEGALPQVPGYEVEAVLGRGGMGVVFKARHLRLNRTVALKMLLAGAHAGPDELARFRREAEAVAALRHPNIVQVHDAGEAAGLPYFTMECVEGGSLAESLAGQPQAPRRAAELVATLAAAVQFAHQSGFLHRDLKPANVLLTADGVPRITDFGLARSIHAGPQVTQSGACLGTPSYMAPEQALGRASAVGPAVDIYALGGMLYEMLTGRPPFAGETTAATLQLVIAADPAPPSRLNARVPRDLDTICLKCLHKNPARRYASAQDLADDLHRFLDGKPVLARPVGVCERAVKWARRRPALALLLGALLILLGAAIGAAVWLHQEEAERRAAGAQREQRAREVLEAALRRCDELRQEERWDDAQHLLTLAAPRVAEANSPPHEKRFHQAQSDCRIAARLEAARESNPRTPNGTIDYPQWAAEFQKAFEYAGLRMDDEVEAVAAHVQASTIRPQLVAAIEHRAFVALMLKDMPLVERLLTIARSADPEPLWRDRFRSPAAWKSQEKLLQLAGDAFTSPAAPAEHQLALLGLLLNRVASRNEGIRLLAEACRRQPRNFWVHREMGFALVLEKRWLEAAGYCRVALSLRPDNAGAHEGLGLVLENAGQIEEALAAYRRAVELSPKTRSLQTRLVAALASAGYWQDAEAACRRALEIDPTNHYPPYYLGHAFSQADRPEGAVVLFRNAAEIAPENAEVQNALGRLCARTARHAEAVTAFRKGVDLKVWHYVPEQFLAQELAAAGRWEEGVAVLAAAAARDPKNTRFHMDAGKLLRSHGKPEEAARAFEKATRTAPFVPAAWEGLMAARLDQGDFVRARAAAVALRKLQAKEADRKTRQRHLDLCDALLAVAADLPAILAGKERPAPAATRLAVAEWCWKHQRLPATAADFYASAFAAQAALADDLEAGHRFDAACAAALAGCGVGKDAAPFAELRRPGLRRQALAWLTAEYEAWAARHRAGKPGDRTAAAKAARSWQQNEELAGVRDEQALARLADDERRDWQAFWARVATLAGRDPVAQLNQARAHVARREWAKAVPCYAAVLELEPTDRGEIWFEYAAVQLLAGDRPGYRSTCAHMLAQCDKNPEMVPHLAARAYMLAPDKTGVPKLVLSKIADELARHESESWALTGLGAWHLRVGRIRDPVAYFERSLAADGRPGRAVLNWLWLALAHQKLGRPEEARRWLARAVNWLDQQGGKMPPEIAALGSHRHNWLEAHVLRQEVEARLR
jgi:serine/threonine-protein kinase